MRDIRLKPVVWEWEDEHWLVHVHWTEVAGWEWEVAWSGGSKYVEHEECGRATSYEDARRKALKAMRAIEERVQ